MDSCLIKWSVLGWQLIIGLSCPLVGDNRKIELFNPGSIHFNKTRRHSCRMSSNRRLYHSVTFNFVIHFLKQKAIPLCFYLSLSYISSSWRLYHSVIFKFIIHFVKLKTITHCYIYVCHTFHQGESYTTQLYLSLSYISSSWRL